MKITIDIPNGTILAVFTYVFQKHMGLNLGTHIFETDDLFDGACVTLPEEMKSDD